MSNENSQYTQVFVTPKQIISKYQITRQTLQRWAQKGDIQYRITPNGRYLYNKNQVQEIFKTGSEQEEVERLRICYARVSSTKQKEDLQRQIEEFEKEYPGHKIYKDIGSGLNWKRTNFQRIVVEICSGLVSEIVVMHRDRLCRYGFELIELLCKQFQTKLLVHCENEEENQHKSTEEELSQDLLSIVNIFVARNNGKRASKNKKRRDGKRKREEEKEDSSQSKINNKKSKANEGTSSKNMESEIVSNQRGEKQIESNDGNLSIHLQ